MLLVGAGWRAFFAPWDYDAADASPAGGPNILDLERQGPFNTAPVAAGAQGYTALKTAAGATVAGWTDTGWIKEFKVSPQSKIGQVRSGYRGAVRAQYKGEIGEQFEFKFRESGRLQWKLSTGTTVYNLLYSVGSPGTTGPVSSAGSTAVAMGASGYIASGAVANYTGYATLYVPSGSGAAFPANSYLVCDEDYNGTDSGVVGSNGAFLFPNATTDVDYIRKTSDFVARVVAVVTGLPAGQDALILDQPFVGGGSPAATNGTPPTTSKVQRIVGWSAREGGTFIQEWSGLFITDTVDGAQIAFYYPHVSISQFRGLNPWAIENIGNTEMTGNELDCMFEALAYDDPEDGETIVGYRAFYPNARVQNPGY